MSVLFYYIINVYMNIWSTFCISISKIYKILKVHTVTKNIKKLHKVSCISIQRYKFLRPIFFLSQSDLLLYIYSIWSAIWLFFSIDFSKYFLCFFLGNYHLCFTNELIFLYLFSAFLFSNILPTFIRITR